MNRISQLSPQVRLIILIGSMAYGATVLEAGFVFSGSAPTPPDNAPESGEMVLLSTDVKGPTGMDVRETYDFFLEGEFYNTRTGLTEIYAMNTVDWDVSESSLPAEGLSIGSDGLFEAKAYPSAQYPRSVSIDSATTEGAPNGEDGEPIEYTDSQPLSITQPAGYYSYSEWVSAETTLAPEESGETQDPDADRSLNVIEFALNMDPKAADTMDVVSSSYDRATGDYTFSFTVPNDRAAISYVVETTNDLSADPIVWTEQTLTFVSETTETETWSATVNLGDAGYARLRVETY